MPVTPEYDDGLLDIGLPGGDRNPDSAQSHVRVRKQPMQVAASVFAFAGFPGQSRHVLGPRSRVYRWECLLRTVDEATLLEIESEIEAYRFTGGHRHKDALGEVRTNVVLIDYQLSGGFDVINGGPLAGWIRRESVILFEDQTPA